MVTLGGVENVVRATESTPRDPRVRTQVGRGTHMTRRPPRSGLSQRETCSAVVRARDTKRYTAWYGKGVSTTIKVNSDTRDRLAGVAREQGVSNDTALQHLIDEHEMNQVHAAYARLQEDPQAWAAYTRDLDEWDSTVADGLDSERAR